MSAKEVSQGVAVIGETATEETGIPGEDLTGRDDVRYDDDEEKPFDLGPGEQIENPMQRPILSKVVVNIGVGEAGEKVARAANLLESLTGQKAVRTAARKTNRDLGVRKSELIGCKVTLRKERAEEFLRRALDAVDGTVQSRWFDGEGNFAFGIEEHINIPGVQYDPQIGIYGMDVCVTVERPGYRIKRRKLRKRKVPGHHRVDRLQSMRFIRDKFGVRVV
jgi:large subunit ribosomal protein L5